MINNPNDVSLDQITKILVPVLGGVGTFKAGQKLGLSGPQAASIGLSIGPAVGKAIIDGLIDELGKADFKKRVKKALGL